MRMVDWSLARQVARLAAGQDELADTALDMPALCAEMGERVASYTALDLAGRARESIYVEARRPG